MPILILTFQGLALHQIQIVVLTEDAVFEAPTQTLQVSVVYVEVVALHGSRKCSSSFEIKAKNLKICFRRGVKLLFFEYFSEIKVTALAALFRKKFSIMTSPKWNLLLLLTTSPYTCTFDSSSLT